jgi:ABC-type multidrug transport system fused ATPase/permease subunit
MQGATDAVVGRVMVVLDEAGVLSARNTQSSVSMEPAEQKRDTRSNQNSHFFQGFVGGWLWSLSELLLWAGVLVWALYRYLSQFTQYGSSLGASSEMENAINMGASAQPGSSVSWLMLIILARLAVGQVSLEYQVREWEESRKSEEVRGEN